MSAALDALKWPAVIALVTLSALFAGLTLGMLSLDKIELEVVVAGEDKKLSECARKIIPVRRNGNLLLCTFLIGNTACNSLSSILMADLEGGIVGFIVSTVLILFFAEIIPQAICSRYALQIGAKVIWIVKFFIILFYPVAKPISMILDLALGEEIGTIHTRQELSKLLQIHVTEGAIDHESGNILQGALKTMNKMKVTELMTPIEDCYMLHISLTLDFKTVGEIFETGYSRIPVYDKDKSDVVALLFAKDLIMVDPDDETPLRYFVSIFGRPVDTFTDSLTVRLAFVKLKQGHCHLALVKDADSRLIGVITLEDIVEEIIQGDINDETDIHVGHFDKLRKQKSKFRLLNAEIRDSLLDPEEVKALTSHLMQNVALIREAKLDRLCLEWLLQQSQVQLVEDEHKLIYQKGVVADFCVVVLTGRLEIQSGENEFRNDAGSFSVVAPEALFQDTYTPDFTARIGSEKARIVMIKKSVLDAVQKVYCLTVPKAHSIGVHGETAASAADPNLRHAFAQSVYTRKIRKGSLEPDHAHKDPRFFISEPAFTRSGTKGTSEPVDPNDTDELDDIRMSVSTSKLPSG